MNDERTTINIVVGLLGLVVLFGMGIGGYLAIDDKNVPDFIIATTSGAIGAIASLLSKTSSGPTPVQVVNEPAEAVPVADVPVKKAKK